jgi:hypothetical protein
LPAPTSRYDLPLYASAKVARDRHIEVARALYSVPGEHIGAQVDVRADRSLVKIWLGGELIKVHPRQPVGGRSTDPADLPDHKRAYATRDLDYLPPMTIDRIGYTAGSRPTEPPQILRCYVRSG